MNGVIEGSVVGMHVQDGVNIVIKNVDFVDHARAVLVETGTAIQIDNCSFRSMTELVIAATGLSNASITNCVMADNVVSSVINIGTSNTILVDHVSIAENNNATGSSLSCIQFNAVNNAYLSNSAINNNSSDQTLLRGIAIDDSANIVLDTMQMNNNSTTNSVLFRGVFIQGSSSCSINNMTYNHNTADGADSSLFIGVSATDTIVSNCVASQNSFVGTGTLIYFETATNPIVDGCSVIGNGVATTGIGIAESTNPIVQNNMVQENAVDFGISISQCTQGIVYKNTVNSNTTTTNGINIEAVISGSLPLVTANTAQNNAQNYLLDPGDSIPLVVIVKDPLFISAAPTPIDNLDVS
jgi:parallel beta-helix repeat protein